MSIKLFYILLLVAACRSGEEDSRYAQHDLSISNPVWTRTDPHHVYKETEVCEHDFTIRNTSDSFAYTRIIVRFTYLDQHHKPLASHLSKIIRTINPGQSFRVKGASGGIVEPGTDTATVAIVTATKVLKRPSL